MQYTLDSLVQVEEALKAGMKNRKVISEPVILSGAELSQLSERENLAYFGVLTAPSEKVITLQYRGSEVLQMDPKSQIIEVFTNLVFVDPEGLEADPGGLFRGFIITIQS